MYTRYILIVIKLKNNSCEIEDLVETCVCKLGVILRSREKRVSCRKNSPCMTKTPFGAADFKEWVSIFGK